VSDRQYSDEYARGYADALLGAGPDYGQDTIERMRDYCAGYSAGKRETEKADRQTVLQVNGRQEAPATAERRTQRRGYSSSGWVPRRHSTKMRRADLAATGWQLNGGDDSTDRHKEDQ